MSLKIRRVVTGHDNQGRSKVLIDETVGNVISSRPGAQSSVIWSSTGFPVSNDGDHDPSHQEIATTIDNGTVFRIVYYGPGVAPRNHRTDSIDYAVVISGEIDMELDVGSVHLKAGDVRSAARHHPQLGEQGQRALHHRLQPDCLEAGHCRRQAAARARVRRRATRPIPGNSGKFPTH